MAYGTTSTPAVGTYAGEFPAYELRVSDNNGVNLILEVWFMPGQGPTETDADQAFQSALDALIDTGFSLTGAQKNYTATSEVTPTP